MRIKRISNGRGPEYERPQGERGRTGLASTTPPYGASLARPILRLGPQDRVLEEYVKAEISREMMRLAARGEAEYDHERGAWRMKPKG